MSDPGICSGETDSGSVADRIPPTSSCLTAEDQDCCGKEKKSSVHWVPRKMVEANAFYIVVDCLFKTSSDGNNNNITG